MRNIITILICTIANFSFGQERNDIIQQRIEFISEQLETESIDLTNLLEQTQPLFVTITRFPRCENVNIDAFAVQNVTTPLGFCGSTIVNLFGKDSLTDCMQNLGYNTLFEDFNEINDISYFDKCDDEQYQNMTLFAYTFVKNIS